MKLKKTYEEKYRKGTHPDIYGVKRIQEIFARPSLSPQDLDLISVGQFNDGEKLFITVQITYTLDK